MIGTPELIIRWLFQQDRDKKFEIKAYREKRSLNANAYAWVLIGKIADAIGLSKEECYLIMLKNYGQSEVISVLSTIDISGFIKYYEEFGRSTLNGKEFTHYKVFKGSSEYDTKEMAVLIDGIIHEAENLHIETLPPHEIERIKSEWHP